MIFNTGDKCNRNVEHPFTLEQIQNITCADWHILLIYLILVMIGLYILKQIWPIIRKLLRACCIAYRELQVDVNSNARSLASSNININIPNHRNDYKKEVYNNSDPESDI